MKSIFFSLSIVLSFALFSCKNDSTSNADSPSGNLADVSQMKSPANVPAGGVAKPNETTIATGPTTTIKLSASSYDFGTVNEGDIVETSVKVTNTGKEPLVITNCHASCGCTTPTCPKEPVAPGQTVEVPIKFDTKGKPGPQKKEVTITANTDPAQTKFLLQGTVKKKPQG